MPRGIEVRMPARYMAPRKEIRFFRNSRVLLGVESADELDQFGLNVGQSGLGFLILSAQQHMDVALMFAR